MSDRKKKQKLEDTDSSSPSSSSPSTSSDSDQSSKRRRGHRKERRRRSHVRSKRERERRREKDEKRRRNKRDRKESSRHRERKESKMRREGKKKRNYDSDEIREDWFDSSSSESGEEERLRVEPETVVREMMREFPNVGNDLKQLLQMIDNGQAVDIKGISERLPMKHLKKLFFALNLEENGDRVFLLPPKVRPTLEVIGPLIHSYIGSREEQIDTSATVTEIHSVSTDMRDEKMVDDPEAPSAGPQRRKIYEETALLF